jgi:hypothetical protein
VTVKLVRTLGFGLFYSRCFCLEIFVEIGMQFQKFKIFLRFYSKEFFAECMGHCQIGFLTDPVGLLS